MEEVAVSTFDKMKPELKGFLDLGIKWIPKLGEYFIEVFGIVASGLKFIREHKELIEGIAIAMVWYYTTIAVTSGITKGLAFADLALFTAQALLEGATWSSAAAMWGLNTAMLANPVFWVIGGLMLLGAGIKYAWDHFEGFRVFLYGLWESFKQVFSNIGDFFKKIFEPIVKAIDDFKNGNYAAAAKDVALMAFNLTPVGLAVQATKFAADGGFTKGVSDKWAVGAAEGHKSWADSHKKGEASANPYDILKNHNLNKGYNTQAGGDASSKGEGSNKRSVVVTIQKIIGIENVHVNKLEDAGTRAAAHITNALIGGVRDFETGIAADR